MDFAVILLPNFYVLTKRIWGINALLIITFSHADAIVVITRKIGGFYSSDFSAG